MLNKRLLLLPAAALAMTLGTTVSSFAECDTATLTKYVGMCSDINTSDANMAYVGFARCQAEHACALSRGDIAMIRGTLSDAYGAMSGDDAKAALTAASELSSQVGMECTKDGDPLKVLDACTPDDVLKAASGS